MDFFGHFDIWNNLEKKIFFCFSKIHRGDPMTKKYFEEKNEKNFFFQIIPDIKMATKIHYKKHLQKFLTPWEHLKK